MTAALALVAVTQKLSWYVTRSSGLIAWVMLTASLVWGLSLSSRSLRRRGLPAWLLDLHKHLALLSVVFTAVHLLALVADNYVAFGWRDLFVPMASHWRPGPVAWGIVALYLLAAIQLTSWAMKWLPRKLWHAVHMSSLALFVTATVHGVQAGADRGNRFFQWGMLVGITLVCTLLIFRVVNRREPVAAVRTDTAADVQRDSVRAS